MNKKLLLSGAALLAASTAIAQISDTPVFDSDKSERSCTLEIAPPEICAGNMSQIVFTTDNDEVVVLDENFKEIKRFSFGRQEGKSTRTEYIAVPVLEINDQSEYPIAEGTKFTVSTALSYIQENFTSSIRKVEEHGTETWFVTDYYQDWRYGENIPSSYYILKSDGSLLGVHVNHGNIIGYTDNWVQEYEPRTEEFSYGLSDTYLNIDGRDIDDSLSATQKLYNDDDAYEYFVPILSYTTEEHYNGSCIDGMYERKTIYEGDAITGVKLMNDRGETLQTLDAPYLGIDAYIIGGNKYCSTEGKKYYRIGKSGSSALAEISLPSGVSISPRVAQRSTPIDITVGDAATTRTIKVIGTNGMVMTTTEIPAGSTSTTINTSRFPAGMYVVVVNDGDKMVENSKIIIR